MFEAGTFGSALASARLSTLLLTTLLAALLTTLSTLSTSAHAQTAPAGAAAAVPSESTAPPTSATTTATHDDTSGFVCEALTFREAQRGEADTCACPVELTFSQQDALEYPFAVAGSCDGLVLFLEENDQTSNFSPEGVNEHCLFELSDEVKRSHTRFWLKRDGKTIATINITNAPRACAPLKKPEEPIELQGPTVDHCFALVHIENDLGISDQNYTDGERLEVGKVADSVGFFDVLTFEHSSKIVAGHIGLSMYTPTDISWPSIIPDERPYAGWMYIGAQLASQKWEGADAESVGRWRSTLRWELSLGALGDPGTGAIQRWIHYAFSNSPNPVGWQNGLHLQTLPAVYVSVKWLESMLRITRYFDLSAMGQVELGNVFTRAHIGGMARAGWYRDGDGPGAAIPVALDPTNETTSDPNSQLLEGYLFSRASTALVAWNGTLQGGNFFSSKGSPHTVEPRRVVPQIEFGAQFSISRFFINASHLWRGPEVDTLHGDPFGHRYWQAQMGWMP